MKFEEKRKNENNRVYSNNDINKNTNSEKKEGNEEKNPEERKNKNEDDNVSVENFTRPKTISADAGGGSGIIRRALTNFEGFKRANSQIKNKVELVLY